MPMLAATLATELEKMTPTDVEADAAIALADAYTIFALDAVGAGVPILPAGPNGAKAAMATGLAGMSAPGAGAGIIAAAVIQFWVVAAPLGWPAPMIAVPPPNAGLAAALPGAFTANTDGSLSLADATMAIATVFHAQAILLGTVTIPPAGPLPII